MNTGEEFTFTRIDGTTLQVMHRGPSYTNRQLQILDMLAQGAEYKDIAAALEVSIDTVKSHVKRIFRQLGARNATHAVALAIAKDLIKVRTGGAS